MDGDLAKLQQDVESARAVYFAEREAMQALIDPLFRDPVDAGNAVISIAEEFGAEGAMSDLDEPARFGGLADGVSEIDGATRHGLAAQLERLLEARDKLDVVTAAREDHLQAQNPKHERRVHIDGYEFVVDGYHAVLRGVPDGEAYPAPDLAADYAPSLTEQVGTDVSKAQPVPERDRSRGR